MGITEACIHQHIEDEGMQGLLSAPFDSVMVSGSIGHIVGMWQEKESSQASWSVDPGEEEADLHSSSLDEEHFSAELSSADDHVIPQVHLQVPNRFQRGLCADNLSSHEAYC